jgi:CrcB protein
MNFSAIASIAIASAMGALIRWWLGLAMNAIFPIIPLGTLAANLIGGLLMGMVMEIMKTHAVIPETLGLAITTGFLGGLTTFSTFSAETVTLISHHEYLWTSVIIFGHVAGTILATILGIYIAIVVL